MTATLPLQTALPSWLAPGATETQFAEGFAELQSGLETLSVFTAGTPEADVANFLQALFHPSRPIQFSPQDYRKLLGRLVEGRPAETLTVFRTAMARRQTQTGWVEQTQRRFAQRPTIPFAPAPAERVEVTRLIRGGRLNIAGKDKFHAHFPQHLGETVAVRMIGNVVAGVDFLKEGPPLPKPQREFALIYRDGNLVDSVLRRMSSPRLVQLGQVVIKIYLGKTGKLHIGHRYRATFEQYGNYPVEAEIRNGVVVEVRILKPSANLWSAKEVVKDGVKNFSLVYDETGKLVDAFNGFLHSRKRYYFGDDVDYRGWPIPEIIFGDAKSPGEITKFVLSNPETGKTIRLDAKKYRQELADIATWVVEKIPPVKGGKAIGGKEPKSTLRIGPRAPNPEEEMIRAEQIARVRRALDRFTPEEMDLLLDVAMLYHELRRNTLPAGFHSLWLIEEFENELDTLDMIAERLEVTREWIIRSFKKLRASLRD